MPDATPEPPAGRSFEDMLADPGEQFDPRSELLASIAAYAAAPSDTPSAAPRPLTAEDVVAGLLADVAERDERLAEAKGHLARCAEDISDLEGQILRGWPKCPDGCGCRLNTDDADARECGCDGPCIMECRENGYPDAPSYRDLAVKHVMDERDQLAAKLDKALAANQRWAETLGDVQQRHAEVKRERDDARKAFAKLAGRFTQGAQSGWTARVSGTVLRRLCAAAMCEPPDAP